MRAWRGLLPWVVALAAAGAALWLLFDRQLAIAPWVLALLLVAHGLVHALYLVPQPPAAAGGPDWPFDLSRTWPIRRGVLGVRGARALAAGLIGLVIATFALAGLSTVDLAVSIGWWPALVGLGSVLSLALLVLFFDPQLLAGVAIDLALLWLVLGAGWTPASA